MAERPRFPIVEANLLLPEEGVEGRLAICTNTMAPGQVLSEIDSDLRPNVAVLGSLVVSRDGTERMVLNSLVHPTLQEVVLFSEESSTFAPSTNLLNAVMHGYREDDPGNAIEGGVGASPHFPNIPEEVFDEFRDLVTILPLYMSKRPSAKETIAEYMEWLRVNSGVDGKIIDLLEQVNKKDKIYFDALREVIRRSGEIATKGVKVIPMLEAASFQQLQPPVTEVEPSSIERSRIPFGVKVEDGLITVSVEIDGQTLRINGEDEFALAYSLVKHLGDKKDRFSPKDQLLLGAEIARLTTNPEADAFADHTDIGEAQSDIALQPSVKLKTDKDFYYVVGVKEGRVSVKCMAHDACADVFELRSSDAGAILERVAEDNRFMEYELDMLHRIDVGMQVARASVAAEKGLTFVQDFKELVSTNTSDLPFVMVEADSFSRVHQLLLRRIYLEGLTEQHGDAHKGLGRTAVALAVYREADVALADMPRIYAQGNTPTEVTRQEYAAQLLRQDHDGDYSYGERTRVHFGVDQLNAAPEALRTNPDAAYIIQRFDGIEDMTVSDGESGRQESTHDPCLTHDIYYINGGMLHALHVARAHNTVNAYPENIYGLHDAYDERIAAELGIPLGDMHMFSSRANILLLTEEQRVRTLLAEPTKPSADTDKATSGPFELSDNHELPGTSNSLAYHHADLVEVDERPDSELLDKIEDLEGVNTLEKAITYLKRKGLSHNNPVISSYFAGRDDPQGQHLAFFQANVMGGRVHASAVFTNRSLEQREQDEMLCHYIATQFSRELGMPLGKLTFLTAGYKD